MWNPILLIWLGNDGVAILLSIFIGDALLIITYTLKRILSKLVMPTPFKLWIRYKPKLAHLLAWELASHVHITSQLHGKLHPKSK